jgi:hypothetical protein
MKMKIVTNGEYYAIEERFLFFFKVYRDIVNSNFRWSKHDYYFKDCITKDLCKLQKIIEQRSLVFRPVSCEEICLSCNSKKGERK